MPGEQILRAAVIGLGWAGQQHLKAYADMPDVEVIAVAESREDVLTEIQEKYRVPGAYTDYAQMLARDDIDLVSIATPNFLHAPAAILALDGGRHVLCEKPLAHTLEAGQAMVQAAVGAGRVLEVSFNHRRRGDVQTLRSYVESGGLGRVYYAKARWLRRKGIPGIGRWFTRKDQSGGGPLIDLGVHMLDMALHLMGEPEIVAVSGATYAEFGPRGQGSRRIAENESAVYDVEDLAVAFIRLAGGTTLHLETSWAMHRESGDVFGVTLYGTEGGAAINVVNYAGGDSLRIYTDVAGQPAELRPETGKGGGHAEVARDFVDIVRSGEWASHAGHEALRRSQVIAACYRSAQEGREILLSELDG
ncbi:MAG: Gfo/Idh/MocA family oxidoreductase [Anaerolineae bacterium]|nr:Gfo/Idh/MocA family oxidoreductase [Anaerolineae bacterium]